MENVPKYTCTAFCFVGHAFWKENIEDRVKLLEFKVLNCLNMTPPIWRERGHVTHSITPSPPPPPRELCLWSIFFALQVNNDPLPAE